METGIAEKARDLIVCLENRVIINHWDMSDRASEAYYAALNDLKDSLGMPRGDQ